MQDLVDELDRALGDYLDEGYRHALARAAASDDPRALVNVLLPLAVVLTGDAHSRLAVRLQGESDPTAMIHELHPSGDQLAELAGTMRSTRNI